MCHAEAPPVGLLVVSALPARSDARQKVIVGHEIATSELAPSMFVAFHADGPPVGFVAVMAFPVQSTATHSRIEGQEMPISPRPSPGFGSTCVNEACKAREGSSVPTRPASPATTQSEDDGQDAPSSNRSKVELFWWNVHAA